MLDFLEMSGIAYLFFSPPNFLRRIVLLFEKTFRLP